MNTQRTLQEAWKPIEQKPTYNVSNFGRVRNNQTNKILKPYNKGGRYLKVDIGKKSGEKSILVHRLVALTFCEGYEAGKIVDHIDQNTRNNNASNLRWVTPKENAQNVSSYEISEDCQTIICYMKKGGATPYNIAKYLEINTRMVKRVIKSRLGENGQIKMFESAVG